MALQSQTDSILVGDWDPRAEPSPEKSRVLSPSDQGALSPRETSPETATEKRNRLGKAKQRSSPSAGAGFPRGRDDQGTARDREPLRSSPGDDQGVIRDARGSLRRDTFRSTKPKGA